jgi:hypothetical protein
LPPPDKTGTIVTPTQRCAANTNGGQQCAQRTAVAHLCWNHLRRDLGLRVQQSQVAGRGLFAAWPQGLPANHRVPYTGDLIATEGGLRGGPYVLETRRGQGIDAARRNAGLGRWVNDPRGAVDEDGKPRKHNCEFVLHTPAGGGQRVAAVRTLRPIVRGEELLVRYGSEYWRFHADPTARKFRARKRGAPRQQSLPRSEQRAAAADAPAQGAAAVAQSGAASRDRHFERVLVATLAAMDAGLRRSARVAKSDKNDSARADPTAAAAHAQLGPRASARAGRSVRAAPAAQESAAASAPQGDASPPAEQRSNDALVSAMRQAAAADEEYQRLLQAPPPGVRAERGLLLLEGDRLRVPNDAALRTRILAELHDAPTGAHCGRDRMLAEAQKRFAWDGMATAVEQYVLTCDACQRNKHSKQLTPGLLMPLPLPEEPCLHWTTDAVTGLPKTKQGYDAIQVYVDRLTKLKRFALARTSDGSVQLANTTLRAIIGPHGMPKSMVSDRDPRITAKFWRELSRLLGSEVNLTTAQHPQADGQSEREIQTVVTALRGYVNAMGNDWDEYLPALELAFNSKPQASTGAAPFSLVYGQEARLPIDCALDDAKPASVPAAGDCDRRTELDCI